MGWLTRLSVELSDAHGRRARLLAWLLLFVGVLCVAALVPILVFNPAGSPRRTFYLLLVSLGVAVYPDHGRNGGCVLKSADAALYLAKGQGRDRVVVVDGAVGRVWCDDVAEARGVV